MTQWLPAILVNHLWQSTLFVLLAWLATMALRGNRARVRYWFWTAASAKFLIPLSVLVGLGERFQWRDAPATVEPTVSFVMHELLRPAGVIIASPVAVPQSSSVLPLLLMAIWGMGAAVVLISWWRQWLPIRTALRQATPVRLNAEHGPKDLVVLSSPSMPEPGVVGVLRPRLLLPEGIVDRLTPAQLRALIAHERCHICFRDNLTASIHMAVEVIFWFHPAVWWIENRLVDERERACDEAALQAGSRPQDYAEGILEVCRQSVGARLVCVAGVSGPNLRERLEAIMRNEIGRPMTLGRRCAVAIVVAAAVGGPVVGGAIARQSQVVVAPSEVRFETVSVSAATPNRGVSSALLAMEAAVLKAEMSVPRDAAFLKVNGTLDAMIQAAYGVTGLQVEGGASWVRSDRYVIEARPEGSLPVDQTRGMLQSLLADQFRLVLRRETRTLPVYNLVVADGGPKISAIEAGDCIARKEIRWDLVDLEAPLYVCDSFRRRDLSQFSETRPRPRWPRIHRIEAGGITIPALIDHISSDVDRVIIDKTGFRAPFNLLLDFAPASNPNVGAFPYSGPTVFTAVQEQLGLRLTPTEGPVEVLVIDRVERPSEK
jgi:bla regulator protein blaR1